MLEEKNGLLWRVVLSRDELVVGKLLQMLLELAMPAHSKVFYNGRHFSREVFKRIQQQYLKK